VGAKQHLERVEGLDGRRAPALPQLGFELPEGLAKIGEEIAAGQFEFVDEGELWATVAFTILLSTLIHGFSAGSVVWAATHEREEPRTPTR